MAPARSISSIALLLAALAFTTFYSAGEPVPLRSPLDSFPIDLASWSARETTALSSSDVEKLGLSRYLLRRYEDGVGSSLWLYVGFWDAQRRTAQMHSPKHCLPGAGWEPLEAGRVRIRVGADESIDANRYVVQKGTARQVVIYWFQSQGQSVAREIDAKLLLIRNSIFRGRTDAAIIRLNAPVSDGVAETTERLMRYAREAYPHLKEILPAGATS